MSRLQPERIAGRVARRLTRSLAPWAAKSRAVHPDLHPEMRILVGLANAMGPGSLMGVPLKAARANMRRSVRMSAGGPTPVARVRDLEVEGAAGPRPARHYTSVPHAHDRPMLMFIHGGGFCLGDLDTHDEVCRILCAEGGFDVLSVSYRLAPEHVFPAAFDDCRAAFLWARAHAAELGVDPNRIGVGGDSAGGNLSAALCLVTRDAGDPVPALQLLLYPKTDSSRPWPSHQTYGAKLILTTADMLAFTKQYLADFPDTLDQRVSPLQAKSLSDLPAAVVVTAGCDPLRDEGDAYAEALAKAGVETTHLPMPGVPHGFLHMTGTSAVVASNVRKIARTTADLFAREARKAARAEKELRA